MDEREWADRFGRDIDTLLAEAGGTGVEPVTAEYRQALDTARMLSAVDFSAESRSRAQLRRRLLNRVGEPGRGPVAGRRRRRAAALAAAVAAVLLAAALIWPGNLAAAAQAVREWVKQLIVGPHTSIQQVPPAAGTAAPDATPPARPEVEQWDDGWRVRTSIGGFAGDMVPGGPAILHRVNDFDAAQAAAGIALRQPAYLPEGYQLREAIVAPGPWTFFFYDGPGGEIVLAQMFVYDVENHPSDTTAIITSSVAGLLTDKPVEAVQMNGGPAGWIEGYGLLWETGGMSYVVGGVELGREEAIRIAGSLWP